MSELGVQCRRSVLAMAVTGGLLLVGCGQADVAQVRLGLEGVPPGVAAVSVSVWSVETARTVASATATPPATTFDLGVPAEVPLEFRVIARTDRPGLRARLSFHSSDKGSPVAVLKMKSC